MTTVLDFSAHDAREQRPASVHTVRQRETLALVGSKRRDLRTAEPQWRGSPRPAQAPLPRRADPPVRLLVVHVLAWLCICAWITYLVKVQL